MSEGFVETCNHCPLLKFCTQLGSQSFEKYYPGAPGYVLFSYCPDEYHERPLMAEDHSRQGKRADYRAAQINTQERKDTIMDMLTERDHITSRDVANKLQLGRAHSAKLLSVLYEEGKLVRYKSGKWQRYTLPGNPNYVDNNIDVSAIIMQVLQPEPLTTPEIRDAIGKDMSLDAIRDRLYRLERGNMVQKQGTGKVRTWTAI